MEDKRLESLAQKLGEVIEGVLKESCEIAAVLLEIDKAGYNPYFGGLDFEFTKKDPPCGKSEVELTSRRFLET